MKKLIKYLSFFSMMFLITGCLKVDTSVSVNKDKSIDITIIEAMDDNYTKSLNDYLVEGEYDQEDFDDQEDFYDQEDIFEEDETGEDIILDDESDNPNVDNSYFNDLVDQAKEQDYDVQDYSEDGYTGYKITKHIANIDMISSKDIKASDLSLLYPSETEEDNNAIFIVKKGLIKNTYYLKTEQSNDYSIEFDDQDLNDTITSMIDLAKFQIDIPYKAVSSNATSIQNDGKTLSWDLLQIDNIELEFYLYNMTNIYILCGAFVVILIALIILIIKTKNKKAKKEITPVKYVENNDIPNTFNSPLDNNANNTINASVINNNKEGF